LFPFATLLPFGTDRTAEMFLAAPQRFDPFSWTFVWHANHVGLFWGVTFLQFVAALLWVSRSWSDAVE
jgi:hypothetical protein